MRFIHIVVVVFVVILNSIQESSCMQPRGRDFSSRVEMTTASANSEGLGSQSMRPPDGGPISDTNLHQHPSSIILPPDRHFSSDLNLPLRIRSSSGRSRSSAEPPLRERSRSPRAKYSHPVKYCNAVIGCLHTPEELDSIRLIPIKNPKTLFKICKYTFPPDKPIYLRGDRKALVPMPTEERKVLTTCFGEVLAIFDNNNTRLRGIYMRNGDNAPRAKINMFNGEVSVLNFREAKETPLDPSMRNNFQMIRSIQA